MSIKNDQKARNEIAKTALIIKAGKKDVIEGIWEIYGLWSESKLPMEETYYSIAGFASETDQIIKGDIQKNFSKEFLEKQKEWEQEFLKNEKPFIDKLIDELSQIPIVEEEVAPYAWPFDN